MEPRHHYGPGRFGSDACPARLLQEVRIALGRNRELKLGGRNRYVYRGATPDQLKWVKQNLDEAGVKLSVLDTAVYKVTLPGTVPVGETPAYVNPEHDKFARQSDDLKRARMPRMLSAPNESEFSPSDA